MAARVILPDGDLDYQEAREKVDNIDPVHRVEALRRYIRSQTSTAKRNNSLLHAHVRLFFDVDATAARQFVLGFGEKDTLLSIVAQSNKELQRERTAIATISARWPGWDWTLPDGRTPTKWTTRMIKQLRYIALRSDDWQTVINLLCGQIDERVHNRVGGQGSSKSPLLQGADLQKLARRLTSGDDTTLDLSSSANSSTVSIEKARAAPPAEAELASFLEQEGYSRVSNDASDHLDRRNSLNEERSFHLDPPEWEDEDEEDENDAARSSVGNNLGPGNGAHNAGGDRAPDANEDEPARNAAAGGHNRDSDDEEEAQEVRPAKRRKGAARHDPAGDMTRLLASLRREEAMALNAFLAAPNATDADREALVVLRDKHRQTQLDVRNFAAFVAVSEFAGQVQTGL